MAHLCKWKMTDSDKVVYINVDLITRVEEDPEDPNKCIVYALGFPREGVSVVTPADKLARMVNDLNKSQNEP